jgi:hypothetical protein
VRATNPFRIETDGQLQFVEEFGLAVQDARLR